MGKKLRLGEKNTVGIRSIIPRLVSKKKKKIEKNKNKLHINKIPLYAKKTNPIITIFFQTILKKTGSSSRGLVILCKAIFIKQFKKLYSAFLALIFCIIEDNDNDSKKQSSITMILLLP